MYDAVIGRVLSPDNFVQDPTNTQCYKRYSYCLNNPLRFMDPSGWFAAAADQYWNMGKEITDFITFSGRRASSGDGGAGGWGGVGGVVPSGAFQNWSSWAVNLDTKENANYWGQLVGSVKYMRDSHYILYGSGKDQHGLYYFDFRDKDAIDRKQNFQNEMALAAAGNIGYGLMFNCSLKGDPPGGSDKKESVSFMLGGFNTMLNFAAKGNIKGIYLTTGALSPFFGVYGFYVSLNAYSKTDKSYGDSGKLGIQILSNSLYSAPNGYCVISVYVLTLLDANGNFNQFYNYLDQLDRNGGFVPLGNGYLYIPPRN